MITIELTADQFSNVQTALEFRMDWLADWGEKEYGEDCDEIVASLREALRAVDDAGYRYFTRELGT